MATALSFSLSVLFAGIGLLFDVTHHFLHVSCTPGFSVELIHRDSPKSPLHDPASTPLSRLGASIHRTGNSHNPNPHFDHKNASAIITKQKELYLMTFRIGSNGLMVFVIMDTGSSFNWLLCEPCEHCYRRMHPIFNTNTSDTYKILNCHSDECSMLSSRVCDEYDNCKYSYGYINMNSISGLLSKDTLELRSANGRGKVYVENFIFGCTHETNGGFPEYSTGFMGLGGGQLSFVNQYGRRFSYCLPNKSRMSSLLYFGSAAKVSHPRAVTTPLIRTRHYTLTLESITVSGAENQPIILTAPTGSGNIEIDSGTYLTYMDGEVIEKLLKMVKDHTPLLPIELTANPLNVHDLVKPFQLCFNISNAPKHYKMPEITFNFAGGAPLVLKRKNAFLLINDHTLCLAIVSNEATSRISKAYSLLGNLAQMNTRFLYDLGAKTLTFYPEDCSFRPRSKKYKKLSA